MALVVNGLVQGYESTFKKADDVKFQELKFDEIEIKKELSINNQKQPEQNVEKENNIGKVDKIGAVENKLAELTEKNREAVEQNKRLETMLEKLMEKIDLDKDSHRGQGEFSKKVLTEKGKQSNQDIEMTTMSQTKNDSKRETFSR